MAGSCLFKGLYPPEDLSNTLVSDDWFLGVLVSLVRDSPLSSTDPASKSRHSSLPEDIEEFRRSATNLEASAALSC